MVLTSRRRYSLWRLYLYDYLVEPVKIIVTNKKSLCGLVLLSIFVALAIYGSMLDPNRVTALRPQEALIPPWPIRLLYPEYRDIPPYVHPLGTDWRGRDVLQMLALGLGPLLVTAILAGVFSTLIGVAIGMIAGFLGGFVDSALMWFTDVVLNIPSLPLYILISVMMLTAGVKFNPVIVAAIVSITAWAGLARAIRSQVLAIKNQPFVELSRSLGMSTTYIVFREVLPNVAGYIAINFIFSTTGAVYAVTGLFFLGALPIDPRQSAQIGMLLNDAWKNVSILGAEGVYYLMTVILALVLLQESFILLSYGVEEIFNPRVRSRYFKRLDIVLGRGARG